MPKLDEEFVALEAAVRAKIEAAGKLLEEANELARAKGTTIYDIRQSLYGAYEDDDRYDEDSPFTLLSPITDQLDIGGWSSSSFDC